MKLIEIVDAEINISLSLEEMLVVNAALNEICNGIEVFEFETRIGKTREWVADLLEEVGNILDKT